MSFVQDKMMGNMLLIDGVTEQDEIDMYKDSDHINYFTPSGNGFLCVSHLDGAVMIPFAWYDKSFSARKEMVKLGMFLYEHYTLERGLPIYYTGLTNFYANHSEQIGENVWIFKPA